MRQSDGTGLKVFPSLLRMCQVLESDLMCWVYLVLCSCRVCRYSVRAWLGWSIILRHCLRWCGHCCGEDHS